MARNVVRRCRVQKRAVQPLLFGGGQERGLRPGTDAPRFAPQTVNATKREFILKPGFERTVIVVTSRSVTALTRVLRIVEHAAFSGGRGRASLWDNTLDRPRNRSAAWSPAWRTSHRRDRRNRPPHLDRNENQSIAATQSQTRRFSSTNLVVGTIRPCKV